METEVSMKIHVFIVGSKGIPARYGGFETFVEHLVSGKTKSDLIYHVSCMEQKEKRFIYKGAECFSVKVPLPGAPGRILHVSRVLRYVERWKKQYPQEMAIVYILGCRIGPLLIPHARLLCSLGIRILVNPDGLEWKRDKWSRPAKQFLHYCEACLVNHADLVICDSQQIEKYMRQSYPAVQFNTTYIAYGADMQASPLEDEDPKLLSWFQKFQLRPKQYYLIVGRFVPENNYETMITEFMKSSTQKDLVIITNVEKNKFFKQLKQKTGFENDTRIHFAGTVYDPDLLKKIREKAFAYLHGHEVGGTNPSLLEALTCTQLNLLFDVGFNREVAEDSAIYWSKSEGDLKNLLDQCETMKEKEIELRYKKSRQRAALYYNWEKICGKYERVFAGQTR